MPRRALTMLLLLTALTPAASALAAGRCDQSIADLFVDAAVTAESLRGVAGGLQRAVTRGAAANMPLSAGSSV